MLNLVFNAIVSKYSYLDFGGFGGADDMVWNGCVDVGHVHSGVDKRVLGDEGLGY